jgi:hydrogenase maturation protease
VDAVGIPVGTRVKLSPRAGGDVFDLALAGKTAVVDTVETDMEGRVFVGVLVDDDPGRDLGERGHRFFFTPEEVAPLRVLIAGIGNVFLGDDGFGCALARRVAFEGVDVADFGIRGMDLAYALADYDVVVFLDATPRGGAPGTLYVIEPDLDGLALSVDAHAMDPVSVLALAKTLGGKLPRTLVLGCEPAGVEEFTDLSAPVQASLDAAGKLLAEVLRKELG